MPNNIPVPPAADPVTRLSFSVECVRGATSHVLGCIACGTSGVCTCVHAEDSAPAIYGSLSAPGTCFADD